MSTTGPDTCSTCGFWSPWLDHGGDCLHHAYMRRHEQINDLAVRPARAADMTADIDYCDHHAPLADVRAFLSGTDDGRLYVS